MFLLTTFLSKTEILFFLIHSLSLYGKEINTTDLILFRFLRLKILLFQLKNEKALPQNAKGLECLGSPDRTILELFI